MRINLYSQELILSDPGNPAVELVTQEADTGVIYSGVRMFLHSSDKLHHRDDDDDRSAITYWLPKSKHKREHLALTFERLAQHVRNAPPETGLD